jgi:hypothetical protein
MRAERVLLAYGVLWGVLLFVFYLLTIYKCECATMPAAPYRHS